jgi:hypothetical protein
MREKRDTVPDWLLERYLLGELDNEAYENIRNRMENDRELAERYRALLLSNEEILAAYPPEHMAMKITWKQKAEKAENNKKRKRYVLRTFSFAAAIFTIMIVSIVVLPLKHEVNPLLCEDEGIRIKGASSISIYRKTETGFEQIKDGYHVGKGDRFQIKYNAGNRTYGIIFSIDGNSYITLHFPPTKDQPPLLETGGEIALADAFELDTAPGFERFFFITAEEEFDLNHILTSGYAIAQDPESARRKDLELPEGFRQQSILLIKEGE